MKLNEKQMFDLRMDLLRMSGGDVAAAQSALTFLMTEHDPTTEFVKPPKKSDPLVADAVIVEPPV